ncbi:GAF domain-containing protein [Jatrophihabitans sp. YIM 134969]
MSTSPALSPRATTARALADTVLTDPSTATALDGVVQVVLSRTGADAGQLSMMTDELVSLCPSGQLDGLVEPGATYAFDETLCAQVLRADAAVVIPDAHADQRVAGVAAVASGDWGAYLGVPVRLPDGAMVGVLCVFHRQPREWSADDEQVVREQAVRAAEILAGAVLTTGRV